MKLLFFLLFSFAIPCTCLWDAASDTFPQEYYDISDIIFTGNVTGIATYDWNGYEFCEGGDFMQPYLLEITFDITDVYKGDITDTITIREVVQPCLQCPFVPWGQGGEYLVYASNDDFYQDEFYYTGGCSAFPLEDNCWLPNCDDTIDALLFFLNELICIGGVYVELWGECYNIDETTSINLAGYGLNGEIPPEIGELVNLTDLRLQYNNLSGSIPSEIINLENLTNLYLYGNQLSGEIPSSIWSLTNLEKLHLYNNQISGLISPEVGNLINLNSLKLNDNLMSGEIPIEIANLTNLESLQLENNLYSGIIPDAICQIINNFPSWSQPDFSNNQICPPYPECLSENDIGYQNTIECIECSLVAGDLNNDLALNIYDIIIMVGCVLSESCDFCSDINQDGSADILDIVFLVNIILEQ